MPQSNPEDVRDAEALLHAGWRQASAFVPPGDAGITVRGGFDPESEFLIACTPSCNLVSSDFEANPEVEALVATRVAKLNGRSREAAGRSGKVFHMPVSGLGFEALASHFVRRCFLPRRMLLKVRPSDYQPSKEAAGRFAGWLARYYGRAAFPHEFNRRARELYTILKDVLDSHSSSGEPFAEGVQYAYVRLSTDDELRDGDGTYYKFDMMLLCHDLATAEELDRLLLDGRLDTYKDQAIHGGIQFSFDVKLTSQTIVADLNGYALFPEWDYLSGLEQTRETYSSPLPTE